MELQINEKEKKADIAYFSDELYSMLISEKACKCLSNIINLEEVELLPTKYVEQNYYLIHGIKAYDVDYKVFQYTKENSKTIFYEQELIEKGLSEKGFFRIRYKSGAISGLFITDKFIDFSSLTDVVEVTIQCYD